MLYPPTRGQTNSGSSESRKNEGIHEGAKGCEVVTTYEKCGSVAVKKSGNGGAWGIGDTKDGATARALTKCGGEDICKVVVADCN